MTLNKIPTVQDPLPPVESPPSNTDTLLSEYLTRMFRHVKNSLRSIFFWQVNHDTEDDPHPKYLHVINDPAYAHMQAVYVSSPISIPEGEVIKPWTDRVIPDYNLVTDLVAGTVSTGEYDGPYIISFTGSFGVAQTARFLLQMYVDGVQSNDGFYIHIPANVDGMPASWSGIMHLPSHSILDLRIVSSDPSTVNLEIYNCNISLTRQWPPAPAK